MALKRTTTVKKTQRNKTYFFSDVHLGLGNEEEDRQKEARLIRFLDFISRDAEQIFILGDLFDYWFEYRTVVRKGYYRLFTKFAELNEKGIRLFFVAGNHDYWMRDYFQREFGMEVFFTPLEKDIQGKRFYLHHGDGVMKDDLGYKILKKILRSPVSIALFYVLHPDLAEKLATWSSRTSREYTSNRAYEENGMLNFALSKIGEGFQYVLMGHNHNPVFHKTDAGSYVNLGDWIFKNTYAVFDGKKLELKEWTR
jgi:UDP-2,3-diacylglucosamine hydrolase